MSIQYEEATLTGSYDVVGSFPKSFGYGVEGPDMEESSAAAEKPRILLMGLRRSGKSSIQKVSYTKEHLQSNRPKTVMLLYIPSFFFIIGNSFTTTPHLQ